jgi:hypothetical protein
MPRHNQLLKDIFQEADEIIGLASDLPRDEEDEVYATAFRDFPCGVAFGYCFYKCQINRRSDETIYSAKGYYYWETARNHRSSRTNLQRYLRISADYYLKASTYFPKDDEYHQSTHHSIAHCIRFSS